jgi:hypothetical protein
MSLFLNDFDNFNLSGGPASKHRYLKPVAYHGNFYQSTQEQKAKKEETEYSGEFVIDFR